MSRDRTGWMPGVLMILAGGMALAFAWWVERGLGITPCELCLLERWPWRILIVAGVAAAVLPGALRRVFLWCGVLLMLGSIGLAVCHAGVEWGWWPSPLPACHAPHVTGRTMAERLASMPVRPQKPCDWPTYLVPGVPVSMAVIGGFYALVVLVGLIGSLRSGQRQIRRIFR
ncbi:MAG: disulfide bond formation protein B [Acetobacter peroxydans]|jgi:disulfide bond formation protein DsbB|nr:disulfide bond formation protein B [Acetobacter peroxydans]MCI2077286.1 disulfide bond formation protein B [Acetobacter peroxydans]